MAPADPTARPNVAGVTVRPVRPDDIDTIRAIERRAGERFRTVGLDHVADDEPLPADEIGRYARAQRAWVAAGADDGPVGYVLADVVDGAAHIEQVSVDPDHQGRGVGRLLVEKVTGWAAATGHRYVTLTTFDRVPWNRPLYEHLGFRVLSEEEIGPELRAVRATEAAHGLDPAGRVAMRIDLGA